MSILIEPYIEADRDGVLSGISDLQEFERAIAPETRLPGSEVAEPYLTILLAKIEKQSGALFVAKEGTDVVGFIACYVEREDSVTKTQISNIHGYISDAWVREDFRKQGVFKELNAKAEGHLTQFSEVKLIRLYVLAGNETAKAAYEKTGYAPEELLLVKKVIRRHLPE